MLLLKDSIKLIISLYTRGTIPNYYKTSYINCSAGYYLNNIGSIGCIKCPNGTYSGKGAFSCSKYPPGTI